MAEAIFYILEGITLGIALAMFTYDLAEEKVFKGGRK